MNRNAADREAVTNRGRPGHRLRRAALVAIPLLAVMLACGAAIAQNPCPLTDAQSQKAIDAWARIAAFLTSEPRCVNCHGKMNPYIDGVGLDPFDPQKDPEMPISQIEHPQQQEHEKDGSKSGSIDQGCKLCHNGMAADGAWVEIGDQPPPEAPEGSPLPNWTTAPNGLSFVDKDATALCRQIKTTTGSAEEFMGHLRDDNGSAPLGNFAGTAFLGNRGLGKQSLQDFHITIQPPSISHAEVMKLGQDWIDAMGGKFQGDAGCGCELTHSLWSGRITFARQDSGDDGDTPLQEWSNSAFVSVVITVANGAATYRGRVERKNSGKNWQAVFGGSRRLDTSDSSEESGDGTAAASIEVAIDAARGTYRIQVGGAITPDGRSSWPSKIGEAHWTVCNRTSGCRSGTRYVGMPKIELMGPLSGKIDDPNHIRASLYDRKDQQGRSRKGVMIRMTTVDLWRSGSK